MSTSFIYDYLEHTKSLEAPKSFWEWSCFALVGAVLRDNCYFEMGYRKTMPNLYVLLLAPSGASRKSAPFPIIEELIDNDLVGNTKMFRGQCSIQALQDVLGNDDTHLKSKRKLTGGSILLLAEELSAFFLDDPKLIPILTDMQDYRAEYTKRLKSTGSAPIKNLCISLLAASNQAMLDTVFDVRAVYGGLLSRTCVVVPDKPRPANSLLKIDLLALEIRKADLIKKLARIAALKGKFTMTAEAELQYQDWYEKLYDSMLKFPDPTGVKSRVHANVLKLSMILAAADLRLEIQEGDIAEAIQKFSEISVNYISFAQRVGTAGDAEVGAKLLKMLEVAYPNSVSEKEFLTVNWGSVVLKDFGDLTNKLERAGYISVVSEGSKMSYCLTPDGAKAAGIVK